MVTSAGSGQGLPSSTAQAGLQQVEQDFRRPTGSLMDIKSTAG